jgi:hypothetical protein
LAAPNPRRSRRAHSWSATRRVRAAAPRRRRRQDLSARRPAPQLRNHRPVLAADPITSRRAGTPLVRRQCRSAASPASGFRQRRRCAGVGHRRGGHARRFIATQTEILSHTDSALHLAATAQTASAQTAEKLRLFTEATERAWIGPSAAQSEPFEAGKPIRITLLYNNAERVRSSRSAAATAVAKPACRAQPRARRARRARDRAASSPQEHRQALDSGATKGFEFDWD